MVRKYSDLKDRQDTLTCAVSQVDLEHIILGGRNQTPKGMYSKVPHIGNAQNGQICSNRQSSFVVVLGWEKWGGDGLG